MCRASTFSAQQDEGRKKGMVECVESQRCCGGMRSSDGVQLGATCLSPDVGM